MAAPVAMVPVCTQFDGAGACVETVWMPFASGAVPSLSIEAAQEIGLAIAGLWAIAWGVRMIRRVLAES